ncbi:MAG TPA: hypothetical protein VNT30_24955 [Stellaceae bacterium]|nr:hypothetical protein [Stellaceae bacterium]
MTRATSVFLPRSEFDAFLFAAIGEDGNDMPISVLSALARLDVDPWQEAAKLARLPGEVATKQLASLISALPDGVSTHLDPGTIAARLIALLPRGASSTVPSSVTVPGAGTVTKSRAILYGIILFIVIVLVAEFIIANHQPPAQLGDTHAAASSTVPLTPAPAPDKPAHRSN